MKKMPPTPQIPDRLTNNPELREAYEFAAFADAPNTQKAQISDWKHFLSWCKKRNKCPLPAAPEDIATYIRFCVQKLNLKVSTVQRKLATLATIHKRNGYEMVTQEWVVRNTMRRLRREHGRPASEKSPLLAEDLVRMIELCPPTLSGARDRAVLLIGFAGALRRSDIVNLDLEDIFEAKEGLVLLIRNGKTDQKREGRKIAIPFGRNPSTCPIRALCEWLEAAAISSGPLFRAVTKFHRPRPTRLSDNVVATIIKKYTALIGKQTALFSGHSLRAGFATSAAMVGVPERQIQDQTGHKSPAMLRRYIRQADLFKNHAFSKLWSY